MYYAIFKLNFKTAVHFGEAGVLDVTSSSFMADTLFSALFIEALKLNLHEKFYDYVKNHQLNFSDAFPFNDKVYFLPKPLKFLPKTEAKVTDLKDRKLLKKIKFIPCEMFDSFVNGDIDPKEIPKTDFFKTHVQTRVAIRHDGLDESTNSSSLSSDNTSNDARPYRVGFCNFRKGTGLYVIVGYNNAEVFSLIKLLFKSLQFSGIGGKRTSGLGKFTVEIDDECKVIKELLQRKSSSYMTLSICFPLENELQKVIENSSYTLVKRSGFVQSEKYAQEQRRKLNKYLFASGSCFKCCFDGEIINVSSKTDSHNVYRYAIPMFIGVDFEKL